ncbi:MAG: response regulator, partial [Chloroflexota bacterium]|nr:response regulator [Chloroflexota bacterium]
MDTSNSQGQSKLKRYKVLLINDNLEEVVSIRRALSRSVHTRFEVRHADWLKGAIEALLTEQFDVVLADLFLPDRSGVEVIRELHDLEPDVPIVATARSGSERISSEVMSVGAEDYFHIEAETVSESNLLARVVRRAVERRELANRLNFLHYATDMLSSSLDLNATVMAIESLVVPRLADCCVLEYLDGLGRPARVAFCGTRTWEAPIRSGEGSLLAAFT